MMGDEPCGGVLLSVSSDAREFPEDSEATGMSRGGLYKGKIHVRCQKKENLSNIGSSEFLQFGWRLDPGLNSITVFGR